MEDNLALAGDIDLNVKNSVKQREESNIASLRKELQILKEKRVAELDKWYEGLEARKKEELIFHNEHRTYGPEVNGKIEISQPANRKFYSTTATSTEYVHNWILENSRNKIFLDYACGDGKFAILAGKCGAQLSIGLDISDVSVRNAERFASKEGLSNCVFLHGDCENTGLPSGSVDSIICSGMLHHLDLNYAIPELRRILKPGGRVLAVEALNYNPFIKAYRKLTPQFRTEWEANHILSLADLDLVRQFMDVENLKYWHVTSYLAALFQPIPAIKGVALKVFDGIDAVLTKIPYVQLMAWQFTFEMVNNRS